MIMMSGGCGSPNGGEETREGDSEGGVRQQLDWSRERILGLLCWQCLDNGGCAFVSERRRRNRG